MNILGKFLPSFRRQINPTPAAPVEAPPGRDYLPIIVAAAVIKNGQIWAAPLHGWIIPDVCKYNGGSFVTANEQGFLSRTRDGSYRFLDRTVAYRVALAARQVRTPVHTNSGEPPQLTVQDLGWGQHA